MTSAAIHAQSRHGPVMWGNALWGEEMPSEYIVGETKLARQALCIIHNFTPPHGDFNLNFPTSMNFMEIYEQCDAQTDCLLSPQMNFQLLPHCIAMTGAYFYICNSKP